MVLSRRSGFWLFFFFFFFFYGPAAFRNLEIVRGLRKSLICTPSLFDRLAGRGPEGSSCTYLWSH